MTAPSLATTPKVITDQNNSYELKGNGPCYEAMQGRIDRFV